ncbi:MAG TPA: hypothetical protein VJM34_17400 [Novosphingobium sp.]|nr:hypothetical protein [Novosphingobium sp.]
MDLNRLYSQHQISTMRADAATSYRTRSRNLMDVQRFSDRLRNYQITLGASAASGWSREVLLGPHTPANMGQLA